jgi:hypothetical protein
MSTVSNSLQGLLRDFCRQIASKYNIDEQELLAFVYADTSKPAKCNYRNENGTKCSLEPLSNGWCKKHQENFNLITKYTNTGKNTNGITKAQLKKDEAKKKKMQEISDLLNTAIPKGETVLTPCSFGYINKETDIIFKIDDSYTFKYVAIGKLYNNTMAPLDDFDKKICEKNGWYHQD